ncbi:MAG: hypothetical protein N4A40_16400, partial [Tissierellales bacterium]|nr:hypothetical protein [Tissierellales bacterium]
ILVIWSGMFFLKSMEKEESIFDEYYSGEGIVIENSGDKHYIFDLDDWWKINTDKEDYGLKVSENVKLYSVNVNEMLHNQKFYFTENNLKEAEWSDFEEGDLVYYFSENYVDQSQLMKILVVAKGNEVSLEEGDYKAYLKDVLNVKSAKPDLTMIYDSEYMLNWDKGKTYVANENSNLDPEDFFYEDKPIKFKYLISTYDADNVSNVHISEFTKKTMENLEHEGVGYFKDIVNEDGINILIYNLESGSIVESVLSDDLEKYTKDRISKDEYYYGEKIAIYKDLLGEVVSIKPLGNKNDIEKITLTNIDSDRLGLDRDIKRLRGIDKNGNERVLILDTNIPREYGRWEFDDSVVDVGVIDDNYILDFKQLAGIDGSVNIYRLLSVGEGKIEIGFNNIEDASDSDFDEDERVWIELSDDFTWIGEGSLKASTGKNVSISFDENNNARHLLEIDSKYFMGYYDSKSPLRSDEKQESSMMMSIVRVGEFQHFRDVRFRKLKFRPFGVDIVENTKYYEYNYDINYLNTHKDEWENFWNLDFDKVKGIENKELKNMDLEEGDICAVTYDGEIGANFVKVVKLIPSTNSIVEGEIKEDRFVLKTGEEIELRETSEIITEGKKHRLVHSYLKENEANVKAWPLLDEKGWARYIIVIN